MEGNSNANTQLWDQVQKTDPSFTKEFVGPEGKMFTAINSAYLARKATEVFGPCGIGWGFDVEDEKYVSGYPLGIDKDGNSLGNSVVHVIRLKLWYMLGDKRGEVTQFGQTTFVGNGSTGLYHDEDAPKKSITDAISKCLSLLGFSSDVHLGLWDDNKYVADLRTEFGYQPKPPHTRAANQQTPSRNKTSSGASSNTNASTAKAKSGQQDIEAWIRRIGVLGLDALENARETAKSYFAGADLDRINEEITKRSQALGGARMAAA